MNERTGLSVRGRGRLLAGGAALIACAGAAHLAFAQGAAPAATATPQTGPGRTAYQQNCAACHGQDMTDGQFAPALKGNAFLAYWNGATVDQLDHYIRTSMPPAQAGKLDPEVYSAVLAYILESNGVATGGARLAAGSADLAKIKLPQPSANGRFVGGGVSARFPLPKWPVPGDPLANWKPVSEAELDDPAPENWPAWRRSHLGHGFSPLNQITAANVGKLRLAWVQSLPGGDTMTEPLVRDGVLYMFGFGDEVFAFDAATGRQLWRYQRTLPKGTKLDGKKTIALWNDKVIAATSDMHVVALNAKTGRPMWDRSLTEESGFRSLGGPLVAKGVVMVGSTSQRPGGNFIAAVDAETGEKLWTFYTIARPGTPGGDTWNGLPLDKRSGASVWTSGSYDPATGLAYWGVAQTYDTGPVRDANPGMNNDGLFTDSTLAFDPRSGKLVWYYQHVQNDQFDLDWVFDRVIGTLDVKGKRERVVMTAGKAGIFDALDSKTGRYVRSADMGYQTIFTHIDPVTGKKTVNPDLIPRRDKTRFVCPHAGGGRNWSPVAFDQRSATVYVNARDICMDLVPAEGKGFLTSGVNTSYAPPPNSDGRYGMIESLDMTTGKINWKYKQRALYTMGMLQTGGGLLFTGSVDRRFNAHDKNSGKLLWSEVVSGIPNASAITYSVKGKQYVAMITGQGNPLSLGVTGLEPELPLPSVPNASVYVFALPD